MKLHFAFEMGVLMESVCGGMEWGGGAIWKNDVWPAKTYLKYLTLKIDQIFLPVKFYWCGKSSHDMTPSCYRSLVFFKVHSPHGSSC